MMKLINQILIVLIQVLTTSCHHTSEPLYLPYKFTQLNTTLAPWQKQNDLLPWKGFNHVDIINSVEDIYTTQTEDFIKQNPNWLNVDFPTKSIIAVRTLLTSSNYWQYTKVLSFSIYNGENDNIISKGDYYLVLEESYSRHDSSVEDEDESQYRICQISFVTDNVPTDAHIIKIIVLA